MNQPTVDDILTPLAITVIIDERIRDPEMTAFITQGLGLCELLGWEGLDSSDLLEWYAQHAPVLIETLATKRRNTCVLKALTRFTENIHIENVFDAMVAISVCDKEFHIEESELIRSASSIWGFQRPAIKISHST